LVAELGLPAGNGLPLDASAIADPGYLSPGSTLHDLGKQVQRVSVQHSSNFEKFKHVKPPLS